MAKAKKRVAARNKSSKRGKASAKPARKKVAKRVAPKKSKSKGQRAKTSAPKRKRPPKTAARKVPTQVLVETKIIDPTEGPISGAVVATEYESVRTATPTSSDGESGSGQGIIPEAIEPRAA